MDISNINSMKMLTEQMRYNTARQDIISQNVASKDIPEYTRKDIKKEAFSDYLSESGSKLGLKVTNKNHMSAIGGGSNLAIDTGTPVQLDIESIEMMQNNMEFSLANSTYRKFLGLFKDAIGGGGSSSN